MGQRTDAELVHHHLGRLTDALGECGEGELKLGDLLDTHPRRHAGRDHLDHFGRVLTEHMSAHDLPSRGLDYQLAEPFRLPVGDGPQHVLIAGHSDGAVVALAGLLLGEPDAAVLGVGETADGDDLVDDPAPGPSTAFSAATRPSSAALLTSMLFPSTSPAAKMCGTLVAVNASTVT